MRSFSTIPGERRVVEDGEYSPEQLGLPFPKCPKIYVGFCPTDVTLPFGIWAHTHKDIALPKYFNVICIKFGDTLFNSDESISMLPWHEYAHVISPYYVDTKTDDLSFLSKAQDMAHGESWLAACDKLGHPEAKERNIVLW